MTEPEFEALLRRAQAGDRQAQDQLLALIRPDLERLASVYSDPACAAESTSDLVQEALVRIWDRLGQFRGGEQEGATRAMFRAWLAQIVRRTGLNARRDRSAAKRKPSRPIAPLERAQSHRLGGADPQDAAPTPSERVGLDEKVRWVQTALENIADPTDRTIMRLRFYEGLSLRQVAQRLDLGYEQVRHRYGVIIRLLERELGGMS